MTWIINPYRYVTGGGPPPSLAIANTNTYSNNSNSNSTHLVNLPTGISSGNLLLVFFVSNSTPTVTDPSGWTALVSAALGDTFRIYARIADGSEGSTVPIVLSQISRATGISYLISGNRNGLTSSEIAVSAPVNESTATPNPPNLTPSWGSAENLWIALTFSANGSFTFSSYPTDYNLGQLNVQTGAGAGNAISVASRLLTASSEDPGVFTTVTDHVRSSYTLAVRPQ